MGIFHKTLNDAIKALDENNIKSCVEILKSHKDQELSEETYIKSSLYSIKLYLLNYIKHLDSALELLAKEGSSEEEKTEAAGDITKCISNIGKFEESVKGLLKREDEKLK